MARESKSSSLDNRTLSLLISGRLAEVDWNSFSQEEWNLAIYRAQMEGVAPLLYWAFFRANLLSSLPSDAQNFLRLIYASTRMQNQMIFTDLASLSHPFQEAGIPLVVLKGACFALTIYPDIGLRPMGDLDILVPASQLADAVHIAKSLGYEAAVPEAAPGLRDLMSHDVYLKKTGSQSLILEIHHSLVADKSFKYAVPMDWFWEQTEPLNVPSANARMGFGNLLMLTPEAQVLYAAGHAMLQHGGKKTPLRWFYDLDQLIRYYEESLEWNLILSQAKTFEWGSALEAALSQAALYFDTPVPDRVRASLSESTDRHRSLVALKQIEPETHLLDERQKLLSLNWRGRFRLILALIFPSPAYMRWRFQLKSSRSLPYYYLSRWWGMLKDLTKTVGSIFWTVRPDTKKLTDTTRMKK